MCSKHGKELHNFWKMSEGWWSKSMIVGNVCEKSIQVIYVNVAGMIHVFAAPLDGGMKLGSVATWIINMPLHTVYICIYKYILYAEYKILHGTFYFSVHKQYI